MRAGKDKKKQNTFLALAAPGSTVFVSSACIMILELVAGRLVARHLGSSLYTWTSVIGVVLMGITAGNYLGGRLADKYDCRRTLGVLFLLAACACVHIVIMENVVGRWMWLWVLNWPVHVFTHVMLVFFVPSVLLGTISPLVAKMALDRGLPTGRTVGDIYAFSAAGSIAGTFLAGFYLIVAFGTATIIWAVGGVLIVMALLHGPASRLVRSGAAVFVLAGLLAMSPYAAADEMARTLALKREAEAGLIYERETPYCLVRVKQVSQRPDSRVFMQDKLIHSKIVMDDPLSLRYGYTRLYAELTEAIYSTDDAICVLAIGGGGYVFPRYLEEKYPESRIDVVEIDPAVTEAAMEAFGLPRDTTINTISMDARNYVDRLVREGRMVGGGIYDLIYEDALNDYAIPFQLVTREFNDKIARVLKEDGVYMMELIDAYESGLFLGSVVNTLQLTFSSVEVITDYEPLPSSRRTFIVIATNREIDWGQVTGLLDCDFRLWHLSGEEKDLVVERAGRTILTDMYAPVENLLSPVVCQDAWTNLADSYMGRGRRLKDRGQWHESVAFFGRAMKTSHLVKAEAHNEIAMVYVALNDLERAAAHLRTAIHFHESQGDRQCGPEVYLNMGLVLKQTEGEEAADKYLAKAVEGFRQWLAREGESAEVLSRLGNALAERGEFAEAGEVLRRAILMDPSDAMNYQCLASCLKLQGRWEEAIYEVERGVAVMEARARLEDRDVLRRLRASLRREMPGEPLRQRGTMASGHDTSF